MASSELDVEMTIILPDSKRIVIAAHKAINDYISEIKRLYDSFGPYILFGGHGQQGVARAHFYGNLINNQDSIALSLSAVMALLISNKKSKLKTIMVAKLNEEFRVTSSARDLAIQIKNDCLGKLEEKQLSPLDISKVEGILNDEELYSKVLTVILSIAELRPAENNGKSLSINTNHLRALRDKCTDCWNNRYNLPPSTTNVEDDTKFRQKIRMSVKDFNQLRDTYYSHAADHSQVSSPS